MFVVCLKLMRYVNYISIKNNFQMQYCTRKGFLVCEWAFLLVPVIISLTFFIFLFRYTEVKTNGNFILRMAL